MTETAVLSARDLYKSYREGALAVDVLKGAELDIAPAELVAIVGASCSTVLEIFIMFIFQIQSPAGG